MDRISSRRGEVRLLGHSQRTVLFLAKYLDSSGVPTHMMSLARGLMKRGWNVAVASDGASGTHHHTPEWFNAHGVRHFPVRFAPKSKVRRAAAVPGAFLAVCQIVRELRPDILHVHYRSTSMFAEGIRRLYGIPFVTTLHLYGIPATGLERRLSFWGDRVIAISSETREYLISAFGVDPSRIDLVYNGVDPSRFRIPSDIERLNARRALGLDASHFVCSLVGRLKRVKGHDVLIRALAELKTRGLTVHALFAGTGSQQESLQKMAHELGVSGLVHFVGYTDPTIVYWASDVSVLPSLVEGFPLVTVEAMMCGVPVIRTPAAGAFDQIVDGESGFIVPFSDHGTLADRIAQLARNEALRRALARGGHERALRLFTEDTMVERTIEVYNKALGIRHERASDEIG